MIDWTEFVINQRIGWCMEHCSCFELYSFPLAEAGNYFSKWDSYVEQLWNTAGRHNCYWIRPPHSHCAVISRWSNEVEWSEREYLNEKWIENYGWKISRKEMGGRPRHRWEYRNCLAAAGFTSQAGTAVEELKLYGKLGVWLNGFVNSCHSATNWLFAY